VGLRKGYAFADHEKSIGRPLESWVDEDDLDIDIIGSGAYGTKAIDFEMSSTIRVDQGVEWGECHVFLLPPSNDLGYGKTDEGYQMCDMREPFGDSRWVGFFEDLVIMMIIRLERFVWEVYKGVSDS
jgi:hypothetical protein